MGTFLSIIKIISSLISGIKSLIDVAELAAHNSIEKKAKVAKKEVEEINTKITEVTKNEEVDEKALRDLHRRLNKLSRKL